MTILDLFDEFHFRNDKVAKTDDKCCQNQDLINNNWTNICRNVVKSLITILRVLSFNLKKNKKISLLKEISCEEFYKNTIDKYYIILSYDEINEFYRLFQIVEQQMVQMKIKRLIKFNYIDNVKIVI